MSKLIFDLAWWLLMVSHRHVGGLAQDCINSITNVLELL